MAADDGAPWVDPDAIRQLVASVRDGFAAAPVWARTGLLVMLGVAVLAGVFRVSRSVAGRVIGVVLVVVVVAALRLAASGGDIPWSDWLTRP
jgi:hypothetical protein